VKAAPTFDCDQCGRRIRKDGGHYVIEPCRLVCVRCLGRRELHPQLYPDCLDQWHDLYDHTRVVGGTRAGVAAWLGVWP
jgi:hypothetical protein